MGLFYPIGPSFPAFFTQENPKVSPICCSALQVYYVFTAKAPNLARFSPWSGKRIDSWPTTIYRAINQSATIGALKAAITSNCDVFRIRDLTLAPIRLKRGAAR